MILIPKSHIVFHVNPGLNDIVISHFNIPFQNRIGTYPVTPSHFDLTFKNGSRMNDIIVA